VVCSLLTLSITSCEKDLLEKEQYQKEIYLIGAYNRVWTTEVSYSNEEVKTYFTVSSSGTLALDRDVNVKMKINEELVDIYNKKYWTVLNEDKYYKSLDTDLYSIPSLENTVIKHAEGISTEVPVLIKTASLKIDQSYVIPVEIESTTGYPVSTSGYKMLVLLKLKNEYSGSYQMSGHTTLEGETPKTIQKPKTIKPTGVNTVRLFYAMNNESDEKADIQTGTIELTITDQIVEGTNDVKKVSIKAWDAENGPAIIDSGESTYNTTAKKFSLKYTIGNTLYEEQLTKEKELDMLNQAYENHSNFMATSTEIWSELQDFTPSVVYHKESEQTANEQNIGENQENTAKSKEKGVIKNSAYQAFLSAIQSDNQKLSQQYLGDWKDLRLNLNVSDGNRKMLNGIWDYYANKR